MSLFKRLLGKGESEAFSLLVRQSEEELGLRTAAHDGAWRIGEADWYADQEAGTIIFNRSDGIKITAPMQIVGTFNIEDQTWLWGWDHPSVLLPLRKHSQIVREYGEAHGIVRLTTRKIQSNEAEAWQFAALACKLADAQGAYCGPALPARIFMTFGALSFSK